MFFIPWKILPCTAQIRYLLDGWSRELHQSQDVSQEAETDLTEEQCTKVFQRPR